MKNTRFEPQETCEKSWNKLESSKGCIPSLDNMTNNDKALKELATPDVIYLPWCIRYPKLKQAKSYELKSRLIYLLPKFHSLVGEDPQKHLKEFHVVCSTIRPHGIPEHYIKMKAFPFSLDGVAKDWLYLGSATSKVVNEIPKYEKFLKELCTNKRKKLEGDVEVGRNVSALIKSEQVSTFIHPVMPKKCSDPITFSVPCTIGKCNFDVILDLGTSINVMPSLVYKFLRLGALEPTGIVIQLANKSIAHSLGILENVLVQDGLPRKRPTLILCSPFLKTARTKIDVHVGTLSMEFGAKVIDISKVVEAVAMQPPLPSMVPVEEATKACGTRITKMDEASQTHYKPKVENHDHPNLRDYRNEKGPLLVLERRSGAKWAS
ncbi:hypothetical protein CR513_09602, partial [Mucuna pruriens]